MHQFYIYLAVFISITTMPVTAFAETAADPVALDTQYRSWPHTVTTEGLYIDLPSVDYNKLIDKIRKAQAHHSLREQALVRYLDKNQLNSKDVVIIAIMPGGLLYAAVRKSKLEEAKSELAAINNALDDLSYDLLAMQSNMNALTVAQLQ